jgi:ADP-ribose pyrophosphatase YjhB (NUDIX family)
MPDSKQWVDWLIQLQSIAQNGLAYTENPFDQERYEQLQQLTTELASHLSHIKQHKIDKLFAEETGYATPKVDVRGAVFHQEKILLVQEKSDNKWSLPGGWADIGYSASEIVVKEIYEETGYVTKVVKLLALYDKLKHAHPYPLPHAYKVFFLCDLVAGKPTETLETTTSQFFALNELPELSADRVTVKQVTRLFEHFSHPEWPADFD